MDKMKQWVALTALGAVAIVAGGWFLVVSPKRAHAADLRAQAASQQQSNLQLQTTLATLKAQAKDLPAQQAKLAAVAAKIPSNSGMAALLRMLDAAAADTGVELVSVAPAAAAPVVPAGAGVQTAGAAKTAATSSAAGLQAIPLALNVVGSYFQVAQYMDRLENLPRALRVAGFTLAPGANPVKDPAAQPSMDTGKLLSATINGMVFETTGAASSLAAGK